jgi:hypothetical protein
VKRINEKPRPPVQLEPSVPKTLNDMVVKMLATNPEERYQTASEVLAALDEYESQRVGRTMLGAPAAKPGSQGVPLKYVAAGLAVTLSLAAWSLWHRASTPSAPVAAKTVRVLVADFQNGTRDPVFDGTLEPTFALALGDASFINAYSRGDARAVAAQLQPGAKQLDEKLAQLVAAREGIEVVVDGSIEPNGSGYKVLARAIDAATGKVLVEKTENASGKQDVLTAAGKLAVPIRKALGDTTPEATQLRAAETYSSNQSLSLKQSHNALPTLLLSMTKPFPRPKARAAYLQDHARKQSAAGSCPCRASMRHPHESLRPRVSR